MGSNGVADILEDDRPPLAVTPVDRRRAGRVDYQDAQLLALLREQPTITNPATAEVDADREVVANDPWHSNRTANRGRHVGGDFRHLVFSVTLAGDLGCLM